MSFNHLTINDDAASTKKMGRLSRSRVVPDRYYIAQ